MERAEVERVLEEFRVRIEDLESQVEDLNDDSHKMKEKVEDAARALQS